MKTGIYPTIIARRHYTSLCDKKKPKNLRPPCVSCPAGKPKFKKFGCRRAKLRPLPKCPGRLGGCSDCDLKAIGKKDNGLDEFLRRYHTQKMLNTSINTLKKRSLHQLRKRKTNKVKVFHVPSRELNESVVKGEHSQDGFHHGCNFKRKTGAHLRSYFWRREAKTQFLPVKMPRKAKSDDEHPLSFEEHIRRTRPLKYAL